MTHRERWNSLGTRFLTLQLRERALIATTSLTLVLLLGWQFWAAPNLEKIQQARLQTSDLQGDARELESQLAVLETELAKDPDAPLRQQRERLQVRLAELQARLETLAGGLVSPEAMVALLRQMLNKHQALTLESVAHSPAVSIDSPRNEGASSEVVSTEGARSENAHIEGGSPGLYSHGITLTVTGRYFDLVDYLHELEALDDRLGWSALRYQVQEWPIGRLEIHLKTLSLSEEWLGV